MKTNKTSSINGSKGIIKDNIPLALSFAALNAFMLAGMGAFVKILTGYFGPIEVTFFRNIFSLFFLTTWFFFAGKFYFLKTDRPKAHLFRSAIGTIGIVLGAWALKLMPLAETTILLFTSPLFVVLLSYPVLKEKVGIYRLSAVFVGFCGVAIMAAPSGSDITILAIIVGLGWGFFAGAVDVCLRWIGQTESSYTTTFYFLLFGSIACGLYWPFGDMQQAEFSIYTLGIMTGLGLTGVLALLAKTQSYRLGEASLVAPITYTMILWAVLFDYVFWDRIPTYNMLLGAIIIISSNMFILWREKHKKKKEK